MPNNATPDPTQIQSPSQIPPQGSVFAGLSPLGLVDVYFGTLPGDIDAQPAAKELLGSAPDTGALSNGDYIYQQVAALYGGADLPAVQSPSGNSVKSVVFVSGSAQGGYGAFHITGASQADFDRIVVDSLNVSGSYSAGSGIGAAPSPASLKIARLFPIYRGTSDLLGMLHSSDSRLKLSKVDDIQKASSVARQSTSALKAALETGNVSAPPQKVATALRQDMARHGHANLTSELIHSNQNLLGLLRSIARLGGGRQYLSTALFAAELVESFQLLTGKANSGQTDGEAVSRVIAFKLAPEIALIPGFSGAIAAQWFQDGAPDFVNDNSQNDQSVDGNGAGVMFLLFLNDYLGIPLDAILSHMPSTGGAPLSNTYLALLNDFPQLAQTAGSDGPSVFQAMVNLLKQNAQNADGSLNLPANGNPFPNMPGAKPGGLFTSKQMGKLAALDTGSLPQDTQTAVSLETQIEQQLASLKTALQQIQNDLTPNAPPTAFKERLNEEHEPKEGDLKLAYGPPLVSSFISNLQHQANPFRAPEFDQTLQTEFWQHVYNETPGSGNNTDRLQVITGTNQTPLCVQITGTVSQTRAEPDGDLHIYFQPDDPNFPANQGAGLPPLEVEIIYAGPVSQADAQAASANFQNPFDLSQLSGGTRLQASGPLIYDRAHGKLSSDGTGVALGIEIHPLVGMTILSSNPVGPPPNTTLGTDIASALGQAQTLAQSITNLVTLLQKIQSETPSS